MSSKKRFDKQKTWDNIKSLDIFKNYDEFLETCIKYNGCCVWRKYSAYPWVKENVFIGTYNDLLEWYKTNTEVPFFYDKFIGKRYSMLTIESFDIRIVDNKRVVYARCKCDCGNHCDKSFETIQKGNVRTCGCRGKTKLTLDKMYPEIVEKYWDYIKNTESPNQIDYMSNIKYWWKGYSNSFLMSPCELFSKTSGGTSFPEQAIFYFLNLIIKNAENRKRVNINNKQYEFDIYLPDLNIAIEYDGAAWHKDKTEKELEKNYAALSKNIYLIRVREPHLPIILTKNSDLVFCDTETRTYYEAIAYSINEIFKLIYKRTNDDVYKNIQITKDDIVNKKMLIMANYMIGFNKENIEMSWISKFWSKTNLIEAYKISKISTDRFDFNCYNQLQLNISPYIINEILKKITEEQQLEFKKSLTYLRFNERYCPFVDMPYCPCNLLYHIGSEKTCEIFNKFKGHTQNAKPFEDAEKNFIKSFNEVSKDLTSSYKINLFKTSLCNILMYKIGNRDKVINRFCKSSLLSENQKIDLIISCVTWPEFDYETTKKLFENKLLLRLFFVNYNYSLIENNNEELNLKHEFVIYDILKSLVLTKNFDLLLESLYVIKENIQEDLFCNILDSLSLQIILKSGSRFDALFNRKQGFLIFSNIIKELANGNLSEKVNKMMIALLQTDNIQKTQFEIQCNYFENELNKLLNGKSLDKEIFFRIALKFKKTQNFIIFIRDYIYKYFRKNLLPTILIESINSAGESDNVYNQSLANKDYIFSKTWILDLSNVTDFKMLLKLSEQGLLFKFDYNLCAKKRKWEVIENFVKTITKYEVFISDYIDDKSNFCKSLKHCKLDIVKNFIENLKNDNYIIANRVPKYR